ncbi:hypothetical protein GS399_06570 [Pedobacter sp. HMF7647]|uniref:Nuclear transport factor 2 family protein n=1 Tax=Hufsiella arboris TaxID=2695275 RepID=A0A7K1Y8D5_9SPHI|nr:hypothetical protein [Hufsiella arboris]MXV50631.1 hypothetical protein [Hufsiella arboris]
MTIQNIDHLTESFYKSISFDQEHYPNFDLLQDLFLGTGNLLNNTFEKPLEFTVQSFAQAMMQQIEAGNTSFFAQQEIADKTEIFGKIAQRRSVYEYSFKREQIERWPRGVNYIEYVFKNERWFITSMVWCDETDLCKIPEEWLPRI